MRRVGTLLATALLVSATAACGSGKAPAAAPTKNTLPTTASPSPTAQPVTFSDLPDGVDAEVTDSSPANGSGGGLTFVSPVYSLHASQPLQDPVTVMLELDNPLPTGTPVVVATRESPADRWAWQSGRLTSDQRHVQYSATRLDQVAAASLDPASTLASFSSDVKAGVAQSVVDRTVRKPQCAGTKDALRDGYSVTSWSRQTLAWCFGLQGDKRVLTVVNKRTVPVRVAHPQVAEVGAAPKVPAAWTTWSRVLGAAGGTYLPPGGTATYAVDIEPEKLVQLQAQAGAAQRSLQVLQAGVRALVIRMNAFDPDQQQAYQSVLTKVLSRPQCTQALGRDANALLAGCLSTRRLTQLFGADTFLLLRSVTPNAMRAQLAEQLRTLAQQDAAQVEHHIVVRRAKPDFGALVGFFTGADNRGLRITDTGLVTEHYYTFASKVATLTYQLTLPRTENGTTTAQAVITAVTVMDRKALKGAVPHVGDTGTISISKGVVTPSFIGRNYCDAKAFKAGTCGRDTKVKPTPTTPTGTTTPPKTKTPAKH